MKKINETGCEVTEPLTPAEVPATEAKKAASEKNVSISTSFLPYDGNEPYLFISYSHKDTAAVYPILDELHKKKYRIWYDESCEVGNDFRVELRTRIEKARAVILFVSKNSMESPFCGMEIICARENLKDIFPIYLDEVDVPPAFSILLANTHHSVANEKEKMFRSLVRDLPAEAMDRLTVDNEGVVLERCEDNGTSIVISDGIKIISKDAFKNRTQLHHIVMPSSLEAIEEESFRGCTNLEEMDIPEKTARIGGSAFRDCVSMKTLVVRNNCIKIGERAFENCATLESIVLPEGLTEIYGGVFNSCKKLVSIELPKNLTVLGESAFSDCIGLEKIDIPETVTKIDDLVFNGCTSLSKIEFHEGLKKIGKGAFKNCCSLTKIELPSTVSSINDAPFRGCSGLRSIKVDPKNKFYKSAPNKPEGTDYVLFNKNKSIMIAYPASSREVQYDVPDSVVCISDWSFCECKKLNRITIPDSVREIGEGAFCNCVLLDEVMIPDSVEKIDDCAFRGCLSLEKVIVPSSVQELGWGMFDGCKDSLVVYCDEGSAIQKYCIRNGIKEARVSDKDND